MYKEHVYAKARIYRYIGNNWNRGIILCMSRLSKSTSLTCQGVKCQERQV